MKNLLTKNKVSLKTSVNRLIQNFCLLIGFLSVSFNAISQSVDFSQWANQTPKYTGGALNANNSNYYEGTSTLQRAVFTGIQSKLGNTHTITFQVLATKGGVHAYDFLTGFDQTIQDYVNITGSDAGIMLGQSRVDLVSRDLPNTKSNPLKSQVVSLFNGVTANKAIAAAPLINYSGTPVATQIAAYDAAAYPKSSLVTDDATKRAIQLYGNNAISNAVFTFNGFTGDPLGDSFGNYTLTYTSASTQLLILFGGHLSVGAATNVPYPGLGYGTGFGASSISGGPYHVKLNTFDGAPTGAQDNQIMAGAIEVFPASCVINNITQACMGDITTFTATPTGMNNPTYSWSIPTNPNVTNATFVQSDGSALSTPNTPGNVGTVYIKTTAAGSYTVHATLTQAGFTTTNCDRTVTVNPLPTIADPAIGAICEGATSASLTYSGVTGGADKFILDWNQAAEAAGLVDIGSVITPADLTASPIAITTTGVATGSYNGTVQVINSVTHCMGTQNVVLLVVSSNPGAPSVAYIAPACDETTFSLKITGVVQGSKYLVVDKNGADIANISPATSIASPYVALNANDITFLNIPAGSGYQVTVITAGGCASAPEMCPAANVRQMAPTSQHTLGNTENKDLIAYPVPFSDQVTVEFRASKAENYVINLYDLQGHLVKELKAGNAKAGEVIAVKISGTGMAESMYLVRKVSSSGISTVKLLKKE